MKRVLSILTIALVTHASLFVLGTMCQIDWQFPQLSWRLDKIEYQEVANIDAMQPDLSTFIGE